MAGMLAVGEVSLSKFMRGRMPGRSIFGSNDGAGRACSSFSTTQPRAARLGPRKALASHRCSQTPTEVRDQHHYQRAETQTRMHPPSTAGWTRSRSRVLVNCLLLLLPLRRDQRVRIPVSVHARSFPATIRETSSRRNRHLCHRGSNNDSDRGCKISTLPGHFPLVVKNRSEAAARAFHSVFPQIRLRSRSRNSSHRSAS